MTALLVMVVGIVVGGALGYLVTRWLCAQVEAVTIAMEACRTGTVPAALTPGHIVELNRLTQAFSALGCRTSSAWPAVCA